MKYLFKKILTYYLKYLTKLALLIHRPTIIAIAGSINKTFVKEEINRMLRAEGREVRSNPRSFNTEIGLPLAILNLPSGYNSYKDWLPIILEAPLKIFSPMPKIIVLELGVSNPGDMKYLLSIIKPKIAVITDITQRYLEGFNSMDKLAGEYEYLLKRMDKNRLVLLNIDNPREKNMTALTKVRIKFFGLNEGADCHAIKIEKNNDDQTVQIKFNNEIRDYKINRFGQHHVYALLIGLIIKSELESHNPQLTARNPY
jgi:UDP-N-acetylmuramoyl-tripeptide--D-alanyl-D-alanine ligase